MSFPSCQSVSLKVLTMFEKQLDGQMAPEKRDHGNLAVKARYTHFTSATTTNDFTGSLVTMS